MSTSGASHSGPRTAASIIPASTSTGLPTARSPEDISGVAVTAKPKAAPVLPTKPVRRVPVERRYAPPAGLIQRQISSDFEGMMVGKTEANKIARRKKMPMDALGLPLLQQSATDDDSGEDGAEMGGRIRNTSARARKKEYIPLILTPVVSLNWVVLDPALWSAEELADMPFAVKYHHYKPGNAKILEYNLVSGSVRIKSPPAALEGKRIEYRATGPAILNIVSFITATDAKGEKTKPKEAKKKAPLAAKAKTPAVPKPAASSTASTSSPASTDSGKKKPAPAAAAKRKSSSAPLRPLFPNLGRSASTTPAPPVVPLFPEIQDSQREEDTSSEGESDTTEPEPTPKRFVVSPTRRSLTRGAKMPDKYTR